MLVEASHPHLSGHFILKLYDRRFAPGLRKHAKTSPWDPDIENAYHNFVINDEDLRYDYLDEWNEAQREAYLQHYCRLFDETETEVYRRLKSVQGVDIPRLYARVWVPSLSGRMEAAVDEEFLRCPGILIEYIDGFALSDLGDHADRSTWQVICDEAIRIVNYIGDYDIRNPDVKPRNCIVRKYEDSQGITHFKPVMIDFARCVLRKKARMILNGGD
ncbi:hypothetical protein PHISCL_00758 [Aspergillus sclerotialis]|uniref:Protein kinase domain-containing protein n=1 Tax=Aspergillus sclerotialis TaxID=2070753 RepID=A0A3A3ACB0_9EURO|nr:hypothetical protein PHISCL_00758 [Aspergillus sclerotialis]